MTPEYMLSADGSPFEDQDVTAMKRDILAREFGEAFEVVEHPAGRWAVVRGADPALQAAPEAAHPTDPVPITGWVDGAIPEGPGDVLARARSAGRARPEGRRNTEPAVNAFLMECGQLGGLLLALWSLWKFMSAYLFYNYEVPEHHVSARNGLFSRETPEVYFAHVRSGCVERALRERIMGVGTARVGTGAADELRAQPASRRRPPEARQEAATPLPALHLTARAALLIY